jgi:hypothetical protein
LTVLRQSEEMLAAMREGGGGLLRSVAGVRMSVAVRIKISASTEYPGYAVAQLVEALRYKPEGCWLDSRRSYWNFSLT